MNKRIAFTLLLVCFGSDAVAVCVNPTSVTPGDASAKYAASPNSTSSTEPNMGVYEYDYALGLYVLEHSAYDVSLENYVPSAEDFPTPPDAPGGGGPGGGGPGGGGPGEGGAGGLNSGSCPIVPVLPTITVTARAPPRGTLVRVTIGSGPNRRVTNRYISDPCAQAVLAYNRLGCESGDFDDNPPNGCGSGAADVPDFFVGSPGLGNIFTGACNAHDTCYGTIGVIKPGCDSELGDGMIAACRAAIELSELRLQCEAQAHAFQDGLSGGLSGWSFVSIVSDGIYVDAQRATRCKNALRDRQNVCGF